MTIVRYARDGFKVQTFTSLFHFVSNVQVEGLLEKIQKLEKQREETTQKDKQSEFQRLKRET